MRRNPKIMLEMISGIKVKENSKATPKDIGEYTQHIIDVFGREYLEGLVHENNKGGASKENMSLNIVNLQGVPITVKQKLDKEDARLEVLMEKLNMHRENMKVRGMARTMSANPSVSKRFNFVVPSTPMQDMNQMTGPLTASVPK
jgi:hypothetical protein